jgi:hypothetical protein
MDILEGGLFLLMPHELLQGGNPHLFIGLMDAEGVPEGVDADLLADAGLFHIFSCSELILSAAQLDYIADSDLDYVRIRASLD